jgi:hypothetical protein
MKEKFPLSVGYLNSSGTMKMADENFKGLLFRGFCVKSSFFRLFYNYYALADNPFSFQEVYSALKHSITYALTRDIIDFSSFD